MKFNLKYVLHTKLVYTIILYLDCNIMNNDSQSITKHQSIMQFLKSKSKEIADKNYLRILHEPLIAST